MGPLLYFTRHSRPDICNPVRESTRTMDAPAPVHLKEMYKVIRYVLSTREYGLKFELRKDIKKWTLKALSDSDFPSDTETRISVFGYIIYFCGIPIGWRSKGMKSVVLSITEAEYMALSRFVVLYSGCHQGSTSTSFMASSPPLLLCFSQILVDY